MPPSTREPRWHVLLAALSFVACVVEEPTPGCSADPLEMPPTCEAWPSLCGVTLQSDVRRGDVARAVDVVFLPEGFAADELDDFHDRVTSLLADLERDRGTILGREPSLFNRYTLDLASAGTVADADPRNTPLHGCFLRDELDPAGTPMLTAQPELAIFAARQAVPSVDVVVVLLNTARGRANAPRVVEPLSPVGLVALNLDVDAHVLDHEIGHALAHLGDEYADTPGCFGAALNPPPAPYSPGDWWNPLEFIPNLTTDPTGARWRGLVAGARVGGRRYASCVYHPTDRCRMGDDASRPFCPVCEAGITRTLRRYREGVDETPPACGLYVAAAQGDRFVVCPRAVAFSGAVRIAVRGPGDEALLDATAEATPGNTQPSIMLGRGCAQVDASGWGEGEHTVRVECTSAAGVTASNALTLTVRHGR